MAMSEGRGLDISINERDKNGEGPRRGRPPKVEEVTDGSKIAQLFESLGAGGKIKIYRVITEGALIGQHEYCTTVQVDDDVLENMEDSIGRMVGGGSFILRGWEKGKPLGQSVPVRVSESMYPKKKSSREMEREGITPPTSDAGVTSAALAVERLREEMKIEQLKMQQQGEARQQQFMMMMLTVMENNATRNVEMVRAFAGASHPTVAAQDGIGQITKVADLLRNFGWGPGEGGSSGADMGPGMTMLNAAVQTFTGKISDKVADAIGKTMTSPEPQPHQQQSPPPRILPPAAQPSTPPVQTERDKIKEGLLKKPVPGEIRLPPGVKMIDPKDVNAIRRPQMRQAPNATDAIPEAMRK